MVLTVASRQPAAHLVRTLCVAAIAGLIGQSAIRALAYKSWEPTLESELAIGRDHPGKTFANADLIGLNDSHLFAWRVRPTIHAAQTAALAAQGAGLSSSCARHPTGRPIRTPALSENSVTPTLARRRC